MQNLFEKYLQAISSKFSHPETSEMGYRTDFEILLKGIFEKVITLPRIAHDAKAKQGNKPDFVVLKHNVPILYIETKNIDSDLTKIEKTEQMARYFGYANLVLTDYVEFRFFRNGQRYEEPIKIATYDVKRRIVTPIPENYEHLAKSLVDFTQSHKEPIRTAEHLAKIMGGKAQRIRDNVKHFLSNESEKNTSIIKVYNAIKKQLVHDLTKDAFADMYAQTLVYGLFVARYHDETPDNFTRREAPELIPKSNPLLRHFFDHIVGTDFDKRLEYIVNELCTVFSHADVQHLMKQYYEDDLWGKTHEGPDPVIHFYEDFLKEYDPELRKKLGAFYTPLPVVRFIVRSVDYLLEKEFGLASGLADSSKLNSDLHRVQILDPSVGTGTFLNTIIQNIHARFVNSGQKGRWPTYVYNDLLPRIHGFELMMAPYTIAHLKLSMTLKEMGFRHFNESRLGVYLTNSLEEGFKEEDLFAGIGFAESIADESKEASVIKNEMPIMVVIGNPPYSGISSNETKYANSLVEKYKVEPGGKNKLQERKHWLNDDYVKFLAFAEEMVIKNKSGLVGFITNHGYLDNPTFRGMRWHLMDTFDSLYIIDLHGNINKKEKAPDGSKDENIFDIQQGVSILVAVKTGVKEKVNLAKVNRIEIWGKRENKFDKLNNLFMDNIEWTLIDPMPPNFIFALEGSIGLKDKYYTGFDVNELFLEKATGVVTARDGLVISESIQKLLDNINVFCDDTYSDKEIRNKFFPNKKDGKYKAGDSRGWKLSEAREIIRNVNHDKQVKFIAYRPFDDRFIYYHSKMVDWGREKTMKHLISNENMGLIYSRQAIGDSGYNHILVSRFMSDNRVFFSNKGIPIETPLYFYLEDGSHIPNLEKEIVAEIEKIAGKVSPEDILDYIYAVLHSPSYREKYKEFLKIDFPRVPYPKDKETFKKLVKLGTKLRLLHLLESPKVNQFITTYPVSGNNEIEKVNFEDDKVYINKEQYFGKVPESARNFYIGGYQPAQKWLKDRKGRTLTNNDIEHYQKIIIALVETERIMKDIDNIKL